METLTRTAATEGAPGWRLVQETLQLALEFDSFADAVAFVNTVAGLAEERNHHPDLDLRYSQVHLTCVSHDAGGVTAKDVDLCNAISRAADEAGARSQPSSLTSLQIAIDTMNAERIRPFWLAVLGGEERNGAVVDPRGILPSVWFQKLSEPRPVRNRIHIDVDVAHDEADARRDAALAAGGRLVDDSAAPSHWVLADADGNEACVCTWQGREETSDEVAGG